MTGASADTLSGDGEETAEPATAESDESAETPAAAPAALSETKPVLRHSGLPLPGWVPRSIPAQSVHDALDAGVGDISGGSTTLIPPPAYSDHVELDPQTDSGVTVLPADALDGLPEAGEHEPELQGRRRRKRKITMAERGTQALSAVLGSLGIVLGGVLALVDAVKYNKPTACNAYAAAHKGVHAFGCSASAKTLSVGLPAIGLPVVVIVAFALIWVPNLRSGTRALALLGLFVVLVACGGLAYEALSALPMGS